jgi:glutathione S-transferase
MSSRRILWGAGTSRTIRPHWALHELGLDFELRPILPRTGETQTAEFTALSARQKIPLLQDNGLILTESAAIVVYLSDAYAQPHNRLMPIDPRARAQCLEWCFFVISELDATSLYVIPTAAEDDSPWRPRTTPDSQDRESTIRCPCSVDSLHWRRR